MAKFQINYEALDADENKKNGIPYEEFLEWSETIIFAFFAVILVFTFLLRLANVDGESMVPTLQDGEKLIVHHLFYTPEKGDIVIVDSQSLGKPIVKRIIAEGDHLGSQQRGVDTAVDGHSGYGDAGGHHDRGQQRVHAIEAGAFAGDADDGQGGVGGDGAGQMGSHTGSGDEAAEAIFPGVQGE